MALAARIPQEGVQFLLDLGRQRNCDTDSISLRSPEKLFLRCRSLELLVETSHLLAIIFDYTVT